MTFLWRLFWIKYNPPRLIKKLYNEKDSMAIDNILILSGDIDLKPENDVTDYLLSTVIW